MIKINGSQYEVVINKVEGSIANLTVNDINFDVEVEGFTTNPTRLKTTPIVKAEPIAQSDAPIVRPPVVSASGYGLKSPLPGVIVDVPVKVGDHVKAGQVVVILEAMKMENNIQIEKEGTVDKINHKKGDSVLEGDILITLK